MQSIPDSCLFIHSFCFRSVYIFAYLFLTRHAVALTTHVTASAHEGFFFFFLLLLFNHYHLHTSFFALVLSQPLNNYHRVRRTAPRKDTDCNGFTLMMGVRCDGLLLSYLPLFPAFFFSFFFLPLFF